MTGNRGNITMNRRHTFSILGGGALLAALGPAAARAAGDAAPWGYDGAEGPAHWGDLDAAYRACGEGTRQSPIDLAEATPADVPAPAVRYPAMPLDVTNDGHTVRVAATRGARLDPGAAAGAGWRLQQFHFHHPGEHTVNGAHRPLEIHFVHTHPDRPGYVVLGVLAEAGAANPALATILDHAPEKAGGSAAPDGVTVDPAALLPPAGARGAWRYHGSLTTPPCTEKAAWVVFTTPVTVSRDQIDRFAALYTGNNRPVQPLNRRFLLRSGG